MTETEQLYNRNPEFIFRKIVNEMILVPIHKDVADMDAIFSLNDVAAFIWAEMEQPRTLEELQGALIREFDAEPEVIQSDLKQFLAEMLDIGAVVRG